MIKDFLKEEVCHANKLLPTDNLKIFKALLTTDIGSSRIKHDLYDVNAADSKNTPLGGGG